MTFDTFLRSREIIFQTKTAEEFLQLQINAIRKTILQLVTLNWSNSSKNRYNRYKVGHENARRISNAVLIEGFCYWIDF